MVSTRLLLPVVALITVWCSMGCCCMRRHSACVDPTWSDTCEVDGYGARFGRWIDRSSRKLRRLSRRCHCGAMQACDTGCASSCNSCGSSVMGDGGCGAPAMSVDAGGDWTGGGCASCGGNAPGGMTPTPVPMLPGSPSMTPPLNPGNTLPQAPMGPTNAPPPPGSAQYPQPYQHSFNAMPTSFNTPGSFNNVSMNAGAPPANLPPGTQFVSVEEFQRLPGTIISGPGAVPTAGSQSPQPVTHAMAPLPSPAPQTVYQQPQPSNQFSGQQVTPASFQTIQSRPQTAGPPVLSNTPRPLWTPTR